MQSNWSWVNRSKGSMQWCYTRRKSKENLSSSNIWRVEKKEEVNKENRLMNAIHIKRNLSSILWILSESALKELKNNLLKSADKTQSRVNHDDWTGLPVEINEYRKNCNDMPMGNVKDVETDKTKKVATNNSIKKQYGKFKSAY